MKRTDRLTKLISILLFAGFLAYMGTYAIKALNDTTVTAQAVAVDFAVGGVASGIVIRDETVLTSTGKYVDVSVEDGKKVSVGTQLAMSTSCDLGLERTNRIHELEMEISRTNAALQEMNSADDLTTRDAALTSSARALASAVARHALSELDSASLNLNTLLFGADSGAASAEDLARMESELQSLKSSTIRDAEALTAEASGTFSSTVDGYEHLSYEDVKDLTPSALEDLIENGKETKDGAYGKLVSGYHWYFVTAMSSVDAAKLTVGCIATLNFGRWYSADVYASVLRISPAEHDNVVVIFRCGTALADTLSMRSVSANVVFETYSGIRIPAQAVQTDPETESTYVWVITAMQLERKDVDIVYCADDFVIVGRGSDAAALREGNTVVVSGRDLYEGKIME